MRAEALPSAAVANNARWCDAVCRSHGHPGQFTDRMWISTRHTLPFYPNAITLSPDVTAAETMAGQDPARPYAVKDSFARLDLARGGLRPLFDAAWIGCLPGLGGAPADDLSGDAVTSVRELARWETAWAGGDNPTLRPAPLFRPDLLADPRCAILACRRDGALVAGAIAYTAGQVTGISNVFSVALPAEPLWASALRSAAGRIQCLGPLRVWTRAPSGQVQLSRFGVGPLGHRPARG